MFYYFEQKYLKIEYYYRIFRVKIKPDSKFPTYIHRQPLFGDIQD